MSGRTIGSIVGFAIGSMFGAPQLGMFLGSMVGGALKPDVIQGNKVGEIPVQRSQTGGVQPVVLGTSLVDKCVVMAQSAVRIVVEKEEHGKGGGPVVENEVAYQDYTIRVCRSSAMDGSRVQGFVVVFEDGKLVYDARPNPRISAADSAKWKANVTFYYGGEDQEPDPTEQAIDGVGNVSAHRQIARMVFRNKNITDHGNRIPGYEVVVSRCAASEVEPDYLRVEWDAETINDPTAGNVVHQPEYDNAGVMFVGAKNSPAASVVADTYVGSGDWYWETTTGWYENAGSGINHFGNAGIVRQSDGAYANVMSQITAGESPGGAVGTLMPSPIVIDENWVPQAAGVGKYAIVRNRLTFDGEDATWQVAFDGGDWQTILTASGTFAPFAISRGTVYDPNITQKRVYIYSIPDDFTYSAPEGALPLGAAKAGYIAPEVTGDPIPDVAGFYINHATGQVSGPPLAEASSCCTTLAEIIDYIALRGQLAATEVDTTTLDGIDVRGITLQSTGSCKDELSPLQLAHFFDPADFDGKLRFRLRGSADVDMVINPDHLILTEDEDQQDALAGQPVEYPLRNNLNYLCVDLDYIRTTATETRTAVQDNVVGAVDNSINEAMSSAEAQRVAAIQLKQAWMAKEGSRKFGLPFEYLELVGASLVSLNGKRGRVDGYTIDPYAIWLDPVAYDRASAASANVVAPELTPPTAPGTSLRGPTDALLMNAPVLSDANDKPGITWAAAGYPGMNWRGAVLQVQRGSEWVDIGQITQACGVGTLLADLPAFDGTFDTVNTLQLRANEDIDGITFAALLAEGNPLAILRPDGRTEILQVQLATEASPGVYACTNLVRGRLDTANAAHLTGARVAILDSRLGFAQLRYDDAGKTLNFRAVSNGTDPDAAQVQTLTLSPMESLREWQPWNVTVTPWYSGNETDGGSGYCVSWIGRARLGTDLTPVHSQNFAGYRVSFSANGETYTVDTYEQSVCVPYATLAEHFGPSFPWPDVTVTALSKVPNVDEEPVDPVTPPPAPGGQTSTGAPAAGSLGPNGGFPDNTPYPIPEPTTFGTDVIDGGGFSSAGDISDWRDSTGAPLDNRWSIVDGRLGFHGIGISTAYYWPERRTMAQQLIPHYSYEMTAEIESDPGAKARIGIATGYSTAGNTVTLQDGAYGTSAAEYGEPTVVSHTYADDRTSYGATGNGQTVFVIVAPAVQARVESAQMARVYFDNVTFEVSENAPGTTPFSPSNIDFSSGLAGWVQYPAASAISPSPTVSSGEVTFTPVSEYGTHKYLICTDPITSLDALDKWLRISAEVNCNDPTVVGGFTRGGVGLSYAISTDGGMTYEYTAWANPVERGDWTERFRWMRRSLSGAGITYHACILFKAAVGYRSSVRSISLDVTDAPVT